MDRTEKFINMAKKMYEFDYDNPSAEKDWLIMLSKFSRGICGMCNRNLKVVKIESNFQGAKYCFKCGHMYSIMMVDDKISNVRDKNLTFRRASILCTPNFPKINATHSGRKIKTEFDELEIARKFIEIAYPEYQKIKKNTEESSLIDVIAENENTGEKILMQVTKLYPSNFWKELHTTNVVETQEGIEPLLIKAVERKNDFDRKEKEKVILLIDSWPGFEKSTLGILSKELKFKLQATGYKEIWLIGSVEQLTFRIA